MSPSCVGFVYQTPLLVAGAVDAVVVAVLISVDLVVAEVHFHSDNLTVHVYVGQSDLWPLF